MSHAPPQLPHLAAAPVRPPRNTTSVPVVEFHPKTWMEAAVAVIFGLMAAFAVVLGPLFLFEVMLDAHGEPATDAGIALTLIALPVAAVAILSAYEVIAGRQPAVRIDAGGLAIRRVGGTVLDDVPFVPGFARRLFAAVSLQGFKTRTLHVPWPQLAGVEVSGMPGVRSLRISYRPTPVLAFPSPALSLSTIGFHEHELVAPLEHVAAAIRNAHAIASQAFS